MKGKGVLAVFMLLLFAQSLHALTAREILDKSDALPKPKSMKNKMLMKIYKGERVYEKEFKSMSRKVKGEDRSLTAFIRPTKIKLLSHSHKNRDSDMWLRLSSGKIKRIAIADKDKTFVNSHFFFEDLDFQSKERSEEDAKLKLLPEKKINGEDCYVIEVIEKARKHKVYDKIVLYVKKSDFFPARVDFYYKGEFYKYLEMHDIKKIKKYTTPLKIVMHMADGNGKTELITQKGYPKYDVKIKKSKFDKQALR